MVHRRERQTFFVPQSGASFLGRPCPQCSLREVGAMAGRRQPLSAPATAPTDPCTFTSNAGRPGPPGLHFLCRTESIFLTEWGRACRLCFAPAPGSSAPFSMTTWPLRPRFGTWPSGRCRTAESRSGCWSRYWRGLGGRTTSAPLRNESRRALDSPFSNTPIVGWGGTASCALRLGATEPATRSPYSHP